MSGGKGGGSSTSVQIPQWIQDPMQRGISRAEDMSRMGYQPYYGPEVAAFSPMQVAAMQSSADAASAFGLAPQMDVSAGIPTPTEYVGGIRGYGSGDIFEQSLNEFNKRQPEQAAIYNSLFAGPNVNAIDYGDNGGNNRPVMNGGGEGGYTPLTGGANNGLSNSGALGSAGGLGSSGGFSDYGYNPTSLAGMGGMPIDYTTGQPWNPAGGTGPFVAQGMGAQNPFTPMVGGGASGSGSVDPFDPFTTGRGGVSGTPVSFPEGQAGNPDSSDLIANYQRFMPSGNLGFGGFNPYRMGA